MKTTYALLGVWLLSGCSVPLIQPNAAQAVASHYGTSTPQTGGALDVDWWSRVGDAQLTQLLALARVNSPDLRSAAASVMAVRAQSGQTGANLYPALTGSASATASDTPSNPRSETNSALVDAKWEIDLFGKLQNAAGADRARAAAQELAYAGSYVSLASEVADGYITYRACKLAQSEYQNALGSQQETVTAIRSLVDAGLSAAVDLSLARANVAGAEINLTNQRADCKVIGQSIARVVGVSQSQIDAILAKGGGLPKTKPFNVASVPADMLRQRPDVLEAEKRFAASLLDLKVAEAKLFPSLTLSGNITGSDPASWSFGPALSLPILDGGAARAGVRLANAKALTAAESYRSATLTAVSEVEGALIRLAAARSNLASAQNLVDHYQTYFETINRNWQAGTVTLQDREAARRQLQSARITRIAQSEAVLVQWITLYKAVGGGWIAPKIAAPMKSEG